ncbi:MAG TPA: PilZ domain-containing protein [Nitrospirota bacterium]|nr:PilZ domain-containing protein [Nitrospirota bacterium]
MPVTPPILIEKAQQLLSVPGRKSLRLLLTLSVQGSGRDSPFYCRSEDISVTGMLVETDRPLENGDRVSCALTPPGSVEVRASGEVVRVIRPALDSNLYRSGIRFLDLTDEARAAIESIAGKKAVLPA